MELVGVTRGALKEADMFLLQGASPKHAARCFKPEVLSRFQCLHSTFCLYSAAPVAAGEKLWVVHSKYVEHSLKAMFVIRKFTLTKVSRRNEVSPLAELSADWPCCGHTSYNEYPQCGIDVRKLGNKPLRPCTQVPWVQCAQVQTQTIVTNWNGCNCYISRWTTLEF